MKQAWMGGVALATAMLCVVPRLVQAQEDITVTDKSFGCIRDGTKVRNTYIRNADPQRLAEAVRILRDRVANTDRKSTRLNSSHGYISYAVFCLKKKKKKHNRRYPHATNNQT